MLNINVKIFGYKRGHTDTYQISLLESGLIIENTVTLKKAEFKYINTSTIEWIKYPRHTLEHILNSENIDMPLILPTLFKVVFLEWKSKKLNNQEVENEIKRIIDYLNNEKK